jgi:hypothetical protein
VFQWPSFFHVFVRDDLFVYCPAGAQRPRPNLYKNKSTLSTTKIGLLFNMFAFIVVLFYFFIKIDIHPKRNNISFPPPQLARRAAPQAASGPPAGRPRSRPRGKEGGVDWSFFSNNRNEPNSNSDHKQHHKQINN